MKTLHLIRHAKSCWDDPTLSDIDRPLNKRGIAACAHMAKPIRAAGCDFSHIFCSSAVRTQSTLDLLSQHLPQPLHWQVDAALYTFTADVLLDWLHRRDNHLDSLVIVGHNPALTDLCNQLSTSTLANIPTAGYVQLRSTCTHWNDLRDGTMELTGFLTPRLYR
jgi:phosphohistidine phosphatase